MRTSTMTLAAAVLVGVVVFSAGFSASVSTAYFFNTGTVSGSVTAAEDFGYTGNGACIDNDGNGQCNAGDTTISKSELYSYDNTSADLVIPESVGQVGDSGSTDSISITANSITSEVNLASKNKDISLQATGGDIDFGENGISITQGGGTVTIDAAGDVDLSNSDITTSNGDVVITAVKNLYLTDSGVTVTKNADVLLTSGADTDLRRATLDIDNTGNNFAEATLDGSSGTLYVQDASFLNNANPLQYDGDFTVSGTPSSGGTAQN